MAASHRAHPSVSVFLLKTKSSPTDAYEELFSRASSESDVSSFDPVFVPVLEHRFDDAGVAHLTALLGKRGIAEGQEYGGIIFTSQRAVEAFTKVVDDNRPSDKADGGWPHLQVPVYSVGPATTRALQAVQQKPPLQVSGEHTGNGEDLAYYMQDAYAAAPHADKNKLLFLVGDKRRDIIPKVMASGKGRDGSPRAVVPVDEVVVYGTGEMASFGEDLRRLLEETRDQPVRWVVVFSPTGCDSMLRELAARGGRDRHDRKVYVATIGPTTRAYLHDKFGYEPDVCAAEPSPQGILRGITEFMSRLSP